MVSHRESQFDEFLIQVTKVLGAAPTAFIILPLVSAFFIDIANAVAIGLFVR